MVEEWKDITGYEGSYQVSEYGKIKSLSKVRPLPNGGTRTFPEIILKERITAFGYATVVLLKNGKARHFFVHRLVGGEFLQNPNSYPIINHKDCNKLNNHYSNLEWCTHKYNAKYTFNAGRATNAFKRGGYLVGNFIVKNTKTGELFNSVIEAYESEEFKYTYTSFLNRLNNIVPNDTFYIKIGDRQTPRK